MASSGGDSHKRHTILATMGAGVGAGVGELIAWYFVGGEGHYWGGGIGALIGVVAGYFLGALREEGSLPSPALERTAINYNRVVGLLGLLLSIMGVIGFFWTREWIGIVGAVFFGICGIYLLREKDCL